MGAPVRKWRMTMVVVGASYVAIGLGFTYLGGSSDSETVQFWRLAAWIASAALGGGHIVYERYRVSSRPLVTALHTAGAVAIGAFGLAVSATLHKIATGSLGLTRLIFALPLWPIITAVPVFLIVLVVMAFVDRISSRP